MSSKNVHVSTNVRKPQKPCPDCKETNDCNKMEEVIDNFHENPIKPNNVNSFSIFNAKLL